MDFFNRIYISKYNTEVMHLRIKCVYFEGIAGGCSGGLITETYNDKYPLYCSTN